MRNFLPVFLMPKRISLSNSSFCFFFTTFVAKMMVGYEGTEMPKVRKCIPSG